MTSPTKGADLPPAMGLVFPDAVNIRTKEQVSDKALIMGDGAGGAFDLATGEVRAEFARDANMYIRRGENGTLFSGSLRNWAVARGVVPFDTPFGEEQAGLVLDALNDACGLPSGALHAARLTMIEGTVDLLVPRPADDYVRACEDHSRAHPHRWEGTTLFKTTEWELKLYDPPSKFSRKRQPVPQLYQDVAQAGLHVLRFEHTLKSGGVARQLSQYRSNDNEVRAGLLADVQFRADLARLVIGKARALQFGRVAVPDRLDFSTAERRRWELVQGVEATGGLDAALNATRSAHDAGLISEGQKKYRLKRYRQLYRDAALTAPADLLAEFGDALDAVDQTYTT